LRGHFGRTVSEAGMRFPNLALAANASQRHLDERYAVSFAACLSSARTPIARLPGCHDLRCW
jgi:hypothetical protein